MTKDLFNEDEFCRENTLSAILSFFGSSFTKKELMNIKNNSSMIDFLKNKNLNLNVYIPIFYLLSPSFFKFFLLHKEIFIFNKKKLKNIFDGINKKAVIYYSSAYEIYKIDEVWGHYFATLLNEDKIDIYDSFLNQYKNNVTYKKILTEFNHCHYKDYLNRNIMKILIWEKK